MDNEIIEDMPMEKDFSQMTIRLPRDFALLLGDYCKAHGLTKGRLVARATSKFMHENPTPFKE